MSEQANIGTLWKTDFIDKITEGGSLRLNNKDVNTTDIIKMKTNIVLRDKEGNIIKVETPPPEVYEETIGGFKRIRWQEESDMELLT